MTDSFIHIRNARSFSKVHLILWQVEVHLRETERDVILTYADEAKARAVAERIANKLHEKVLRRDDVVKNEVQLEHPRDGEFKLTWDKKVTHQGKPGFFVAMKDYVRVDEVYTQMTVLQPP